MKTKLKLSELININVCTTGIVRTTEAMKGSLLFKLNNNIKAFKPHIEAFNETRKKVVEKFATKDDEGNCIMEKVEQGENYTFDPSVHEEMSKELQDLLDITIKVDLTSIPLSTFQEITFDTSKVEGFDSFIEFLVDEEK